MIIIDNTCTDVDIASKHFVCDLNKCKGACCVEEGENGAPLDPEERQILDETFEIVKPYLTQEGLDVIKEKGLYYKSNDVYYTPTIDNKACAFIHYDEQGMAQCGIEKAHLDGKIDFKKPISCHLYPIRIQQREVVGEIYDMLYYHVWKICSDACALGNKLQVPLYQFLKEPLIRKYGADWYAELVQTIESEDFDATEDDE